MTDFQVSVLIRTTGRQAALNDALESLRKQTFKDFEVIVVEDGPATLTMFFSSYFKDLNIHYEALGGNRGRSIAGNHAMSLARGKYFIFLDEDDEFAAEHLEVLISEAATDNHKIVHSWSEERRVERLASGRISRKSRIRRWRRQRFSLMQMITCNFIPINAVLFHRSLYEKVGGFDEDLDYLEDWMLWLRYAAVEPEWKCVPCITAIYNVPFGNGQRRRALHTFRSMIYEKMRTLHPTASTFYDLRMEIRQVFLISVLLRKCYFYVTSFVKFLH